MLSRHLKVSHLLIECFSTQSRHVPALRFQCSFRRRCTQTVIRYEFSCVRFHSSYPPDTEDITLDTPNLNESSSDLYSRNPVKILPAFGANKSIKGSDLVRALLNLCNRYRTYPPNDPEKVMHFQEYFNILEHHKEKLSTRELNTIVSILKLVSIPECKAAISSFVDHMLLHAQDMCLQDYIELSYFIRRQAFSSEDLQERMHHAFAQIIVVKLSMEFEENDSTFLTTAFHFMSKFMNYPQYHGIIDILMKKLCSYPEVLQIEDVLFHLESMSYLDSTSSKWQHLLLRLQNDVSKQVHLLDENKIKKLIGVIDIQKLTGKLRFKISNNYGRPDLYNEKFILSLIEKVMNDDMGFKVAQALSIFCTFAGYKSHKLLDYTSVSMFKTSSAISKVQTEIHGILALIKALSCARYATIAWDDLQDYITESSQFMDLDYDELIRLTVRLMSLNWYPTHLLRKVFDGSFTCSDSNPMNKSFCGIYQKLKSDASYTGPFPTDSQVASMALFSRNNLRSKLDQTLLTNLEEGMKNPLSIRTGVKTRLFHEIDYVVGLHEDGTSVPITNDVSSEEGFDYLENLRVPTGCHMILILEHPPQRFFENPEELFGEYQMAVDTLQVLYKYPVVVMNIGAWASLPDDEKTSFLMNEIHSKLIFPNYMNKLEVPESCSEDESSTARTSLHTVKGPSPQKAPEKKYIDHDSISSLDKLIHNLASNPDTVTDTKEATDLSKVALILEQQKKLIQSNEIAMRKMKTQKRLNCNYKTASYSSFVARTDHCEDDLSIWYIIDLSHNMRNMEVDQTTQEHALHTFAQNIMKNLNTDSEENDIEYIKAALHFVTVFLDQRKYYELIKLLLAKLRLYSDVVPLVSAVSVLLNLQNLKYSPPKWKWVVCKIQNDILEQADSLNGGQVNTLSSILRLATSKGLDDFYNEEFIDNAIIKPIILNRLSLQIALPVLSNLLGTRHKSPELLEYCSAEFTNSVIRHNHKLTENIKDLSELIHALSKANHQTAYLKELQQYTSGLFRQNFFCHKILITLTACLTSLKCYPIEMLERVFDDTWDSSEDDFISRYLCKIYWRLKSDSSYDGPMPSDSQISRLRFSLQKDAREVKVYYDLLKYLQKGMGNPSSVKANIRTRLLQYTDYVVGFDENGVPAALDMEASTEDSAEEFVYLEDFRVPPGGKIILIAVKRTCHFFRNTKELIGGRLADIECLEASSKYPVVIINVDECNDLHEDEKTSFLMRQINSKLELFHKMEKENETITSCP